MSVPRTPTAAFPLRTASSAYSTWNRWPSGENTVIARSYRAILSSFFRSRVCFLFEFDFFFGKLAIWGFEKKSLQVVSKASWRASQPSGLMQKKPDWIRHSFRMLLRNDVVLSNISFLFLILSPRVNYYLLFIIFPLPPSLLSYLRAKFDLQD